MRPRLPTARFDVALIACGAAKNPQAQVARDLYVGTPFKLALRHAEKLAARVYIMSAHYGLLGVSDPVRVYDSFLGNFSDSELRSYAERLRTQVEQKIGHDSQVISYLPSAYQKALSMAAPSLQVWRPYAGLSMIGFVSRLSKELKHDKTHSAGRRPLLPVVPLRGR